MPKRSVAEAVRPRPRSSSLDQPVARAPTDALKKAVVAESGGNLTLASILADTAATTLPKMLEGDRRGGAPVQGGGAAELAVANNTLETLFGEESTSRWADLAFDAPSPKR